MKVWDLIRLQETVGVFCMGDIFSAIWFLCRADSESIFILLVLSSMFLLTHWFLGYLHLLLCAHCWKLQEWLWWWVEARVSTVFPFMPYLPLLPCLALTELVLMKEIIFIHFLFNAIDKNHSSLLLHAQLAGLGLFLLWAGHSAAEMLIKKRPFWPYWTRGKAAPAGAAVVLSRAMSWNLLRPLCSCRPCFHSGDSCSRLVQIRQVHTVFWQAGRAPCTIPQDGEGITEVVIWWRLLQGCRVWNGLCCGGAAKRRLTGSLKTMHRAGVLGGWKPPLLSSPACFLVQWGTESDPLCCFCTSDFYYGYPRVYKTLLQQQNQIGKLKPLQESWAVKLRRQYCLGIKWKTDSVP